jgi:lipopolysaccharide biosynthesis glycosyltransferase
LGRALFLYSTDRHYLPVACISIASLAAVATQRPKVLLLVHELTNSCQRELESFLAGVDADVSVRSIDPAPFQQVCTDRKQSPAKFAPLLWDRYLDSVPDRIVYVDSDTRVMVDATHLLTCCLAGHPVAAVHDTAVISDGRVNALCDKLQISSDSGYFNSGLLVIDSSRWLDRDVGNGALHVLNEQQQLLTWNDQCALNKVLDGDWHPLELGWNKLVGSTPPDWPEYIAHFAGTYKPWGVGFMRHLPIMSRLVGKRHLDWYMHQVEELNWPGFCNLRHNTRSSLWTAAALGGEFASGHLSRHLARSSSPALLRFAADNSNLLGMRDYTLRLHADATSVRDRHSVPSELSDF